MSGELNTPLSAVHAALGARAGARGGAAVVASYGNAAAEYYAAREEAGLVDLHERGVLVATGPQRQRFLNGMLSNEVAALAAGEGRRAALMTAKGGLLGLVRALVEAERVRLEAHAARIGGLQATLERHRVAAPVRFAALPASVLALLGPRAAEVLEAAGLGPLPAPAESHLDGQISGKPVLAVRAGDLPRGGFVLHVSPSDAPGVWQALLFAGARAVGRDALDALRVEAMRPWDVTDVLPDSLLHETGLVAECHSPSKGCYVGQEVIARLEARGANVSRALRGLRLSAPAEPGAAVAVEGRSVGVVTTAAVSPRLGPIALGYVHRAQFAPGTPVRVGAAEGTVVARFEE